MSLTPVTLTWLLEKVLIAECRGRRITIYTSISFRDRVRPMPARVSRQRLALIFDRQSGEPLICRMYAVDLSELPGNCSLMHHTCPVRMAVRDHLVAPRSGKSTLFTESTCAESRLLEHVGRQTSPSGFHLTNGQGRKVTTFGPG